MYGEEVPVLADRSEQIIEKLLELIPQLFSQSNYVSPESQFVGAQAFADGPFDERLAQSYFLNGLCNFLLDCPLKVKLVKRVQRNHRVQQVCRVQAASAHRLLVLQTQQDQCVSVLRTNLRLG